MTNDEVKVIVSLTIDELTKRHMIADPYKHISSAVESALANFFKGYDGYNNVYYALTALSDDQYIDIIYFHYRDRKTLEWIAEYMDVDVSTIKRNKKRLIIQLYELLEVE